jgi:hypothetical protein
MALIADRWVRDVGFMGSIPEKQGGHDGEVLPGVGMPIDLEKVSLILSGSRRKRATQLLAPPRAGVAVLVCNRDGTANRNMLVRHAPRVERAIAC